MTTTDLPAWATDPDRLPLVIRDHHGDYWSRWHKGSAYACGNIKGEHLGDHSLCDLASLTPVLDADGQPWVEPDPDIVTLTWTRDGKGVEWADVYALAQRDGATCEAMLGDATLTGRAAMDGTWLDCGAITLGRRERPNDDLTRLTVTAPEHEPEWLADDWCIDMSGRTLRRYPNLLWGYTVGVFSDEEMIENADCYTRHPLAVERDRWKARVQAMRERLSNYSAASHGDHCDGNGDCARCVSDEVLAAAEEEA